jgi:NO-binding membrane sensor protein with MHYT domain
MTEIHHFSYGLLTPSVAYTLSVLGSLLGLTCTVRARQARSGGKRAGWLTLAAFAIGGTGIWTMHFMAMLGFTVPGRPIRYDVGMLIVSALTAVTVVAAGLLIVGFGKPHAVKLIFGGLVTGLGVAGMHYTGMAGMTMDGKISYDPGLVGASIVIAVVASIVALWFTVVVTKPLVIVGSALVMGVAVTGMHYTGMAAMSVQVTDLTFGKTGATAVSLLVPIGVLVLLVVIGLGFAVMAAPTDEGLAGREYLERLAASRADMGPPIVQPGPHRISTVRRTTPVPSRRDR